MVGTPIDTLFAYIHTPHSHYVILVLDPSEYFSLVFIYHIINIEVILRKEEVRILLGDMLSSFPLGRSSLPP
jgi:hypothetical protein